MSSRIRLRNEAIGLAFGMLFQGIVPAQDVSSPRQIPDSPSAVRSRLLYAQNAQPIPAGGSSAAGQLGDDRRDVDPRATEPTSRGSSPTTGAPVPDMPAPDQVSSNSTADPAASGSAPAFGEQQVIIRQPVGTAAAETLPVTGVAASRPAGAALAPARQRRVRSVLIRVGSLVGAGVAIGTTMALSQGSPSRPPGSR